MLIVGLTGGIASGKSTVSNILRQEGVPVICADELARAVVAVGSPALNEIRSLLGDQVLDATGNLDRPKVARIVFNNSEKRRALEQIIHPRVAEEQERRLKALQDAGHQLVVLDVPLLFETGWERYVALVIVVYVPRQIQEQRLMLRDGLHLEEARARLAAQMDIEEKRARADYIIDNSGSRDATQVQVMQVLKDLRNRQDRVGSRRECGPSH